MRSLAILILVSTALVASCLTASDEEPPQDQREVSQVPATDEHVDAQALETNITGYAKFPFGLPAAEVDTGTMLAHDYDDSWTGYLLSEAYCFDNTSIHADFMISTLKSDTEAETVEAVIVNFDTSTIETFDGSGLDAKPYDVATRMREIVLSKYSMSIAEEDVCDEHHVYVFLRDSDNDTMWLEYESEDDALTLGYKSALFRIHTDRIKEEQQKRAIENF